MVEGQGSTQRQVHLLEMTASIQSGFHERQTSKTLIARAKSVAKIFDIVLNPHKADGLPLAIKRAMHAPAAGLNSMINRMCSGSTDDDLSQAPRPAELTVSSFVKIVLPSSSPFSHSYHDRLVGACGHIQVRPILSPSRAA